MKQILSDCLSLPWDWLQERQNKKGYGNAWNNPTILSETTPEVSVEKGQ
jgi:hypothetical protein